MSILVYDKELATVIFLFHSNTDYLLVLFKKIVEATKTYEESRVC